MQIASPDGVALRGDLVTRVALRTDLTPIPSTVEITALATDESLEILAEGKVVKVAVTQEDYLLVKVEEDRTARQVRGGREVASVRAFGILQSCAGVGNLLQRSIIRRGSTFAEIYRSMGATAVVGKDFAVPEFSCFVGMLPTPEIARVLQEEAAVVFVRGGKLQFRRIADLASEPAEFFFAADRTHEVRAGFLERHAVPFAFTTAADGSFIASKREASRGITYRPRADTRILNNIGSALICRRKMRESLSPDLNAGVRVDVAGEPHVVITAAHLRESPGGDGSGAEYTQLWLGQFET